MFLVLAAHMIVYEKGVTLYHGPTLEALVVFNLPIKMNAKF